MLQVNIIGNCGHEVSEGETERLENAYNGFEEHREQLLERLFCSSSKKNAWNACRGRVGGQV